MATGTKPPPGPISRRLGALLRECFDASGMTQTELGALVGLSRRQVSRHLRAERVLDVEELAVMCEALGCDPADLYRRALSVDL